MDMDNKEKRIYNQLAEIAKKNHVKKLVLFGSRARKTHAEKSDIDIAVYGCPDFRSLYSELQEDVWSLLELDIVNMDAPAVSEELAGEIERDGVVLYEKV